jgi:hypothetical protein
VSNQKKLTRWDRSTETLDLQLKPSMLAASWDGGTGEDYEAVCEASESEDAES